MYVGPRYSLESVSLVVCRPVFICKNSKSWYCITDALMCRPVRPLVFLLSRGSVQLIFSGDSDTYCIAIANQVTS